MLNFNITYNIMYYICHKDKYSEYHFILQMQFSLNIYHKNKPFPTKLKNKEGNRFSFISLVIKKSIFNFLTDKLVK